MKCSVLDCDKEASEMNLVMEEGDLDIEFQLCEKHYEVWAEEEEEEGKC